jgi:DNA repair exonuclease SbcCD ATPase subunit
MKEYDLLKANSALGKNTNQLSTLRQQLSDALDKYTTEHSRAEKLIDENSQLERNLKRITLDSTSVDLVRSENDRLKTQINSLQSAANDANAAGELAAKLKDAKTQILQTTVKVVSLEKGALEGKVKELSAEIEKLRAANFEGRIRDLTDQRDELAKQLASAGKNPHKNVDAQMVALANEMQTLRARIAVDEAKTVPYTTEELALFRESPPQPAQARHSVHELPAGAAELVASAQHHFVNGEYDAAEADYRKILERDQNNGLVLANLATIELQEQPLHAWLFKISRRQI